MESIKATMMLVGSLLLVLGLTTLLLGILGYRSRQPTTGGMGCSIFGILLGILMILFGLLLCFILLGTSFPFVPI